MSFKKASAYCVYAYRSLYGNCVIRGCNFDFAPIDCFGRWGGRRGAAQPKSFGESHLIVAVKSLEIIARR